MVPTLESSSDRIRVEGGQILRAASLRIPGDPSAAAFWVAAASLLPGEGIELANVGLNPTRTGFLRALERMGARLRVENDAAEAGQPEPMGRIRALPGLLTGVHVSAREVPAVLDELPLLAVVATQAMGETVVEGARELRVKESDRIESVARNLRAMGGVLETRPDGFRIRGPQRLRGATVRSFHDHRIAMAFSIAGLLAEGETVIEDAECAAISYPDFFDTLEILRQDD
jgi:3-phosphoshikimate 1-carboxyvinyltransferase